MRVLVLTIVAILQLSCRRDSEPVTRIVAFQANDDGGAVAVRMRADRQLSLVRYDSNGDIAWNRPTELRGPHVMVVAGQGVVIVHQYIALPNREATEIAAFSNDGRLLWRQKLPGDPWIHLERGLIVRDRYVASVREPALGDGERREFLVGLDLASGERRWSLSMPPLFKSAVPIGRRLILVDAAGSLSSLDTDNGVLTPSSVEGGACVLDNEYYAISGRRDQPSLLSFPGGDLRSHTQPKPFPVTFGDRSFGTIDSCGTYDGQLVFVIHALSTNLRDENLNYLVIAQRDGVVRAMLELGENVGSAVLSGRLPRYVLITLGELETRHLALLDLENAKLTWEGPADQRDWDLVRKGDYSILSRPEEIAVLDGATAQLRAVRVRGAADFRAEAANERDVWLVGQTDVTRLDARTLVPAFRRRNMEVVDITAKVKADLGM